MNYTCALVIGGSRGVGREIALKLARDGVRTVAVARAESGLDQLKQQDAAIETVATDAAQNGAAAELIDQFGPDLLVLAGGHQPKMQSVADLTWEEFSAAWNIDTKIAFEFTQAAILAPLAKGSTIVSFASGAALGGSPLSGGYAGAKRMQHFLSNYGKWEADRRGLGLNFVTIYPKQLIAGSEIANDASAAYAEARSMSQQQFMDQWEKPLTAELIGEEVVGLLNSDPAKVVGAYGVTGAGMEALA